MNVSHKIFAFLEGQHGKAELFSHKITDLKMKKYGNTLLQNLKMAANAIEKSKESLTVKNVSSDTLEKVQELKLKLYELEDIAIKFKIGAAKENLMLLKMSLTPGMF